MADNAKVDKDTPPFWSYHFSSFILIYYNFDHISGLLALFHRVNYAPKVIVISLRLYQILNKEKMKIHTSIILTHQSFYTYYNYNILLRSLHNNYCLSTWDMYMRNVK